jgi:hypothetical protein
MISDAPIFVNHDLSKERCPCVTSAFISRVEYGYCFFIDILEWEIVRCAMYFTMIRQKQTDCIQKDNQTAQIDGFSPCFFTFDTHGNFLLFFSFF